MNTEYQAPDTVHLPIEDNEHADPEPLTNWATISQFVVQVNKKSKVTAPIYANGRQEIPIEIIIQARDADGVAVNLTAAQLKSIRLIEYDTGSAVDHVSYTKDERYEYYWPEIHEDGAEVQRGASAENDVSSGTAQSVFRYVHKIELSTTWIAAEIIAPSGAVFRTNTPNPSPGKFDSWIKLEARQKKIYDHTVLSISRVDEVNVPFWDVDLYYIKFKDLSMRIVFSIHLTSPGNEAHSSCRVGDNRRAHIAYVRDSKRRVTFGGSDGLPAAEYYVNQRDGQATAARIQTWINYFGSRHHDACMIYVDQYGNEARCMLCPNDGDDHNTMSLKEDPH